MKKILLILVLMLIPIMSSKAEYLTIGDTESNYNSYWPFFYAYNSVYTVVYTSSEMGDAKTLTHIAFDKVSSSTNNSHPNAKIYIRHADYDRYASYPYFYDTDEFTLVFDGEFPDDVSSGWIEVDFDTFFDYDGTSSIEILVTREYKSFQSPYPYYRATYSNSSLYYQALYYYNTASPGEIPDNVRYTQSLRPNVRFQFFVPEEYSSGGTIRYPKPFEETENPRYESAISTGYYFVDSRDNMEPELVPEVVVADTNVETGLWRKIDAGPNIKGKEYWQNNPPEGMAFFRNPDDGDYYRLARDTVDDAFAGPIPLGIDGGFYFNGIRYDSFYVSTNGLIALSNRRYFYDSEGNRTIPEGAESAYDPNSMDWFVFGDTDLGNPNTGVRGRDLVINSSTGEPEVDENGNWITKNGLNDPVPDNYGHLFVAMGMDPDTLLFNPNNIDSTNGRGLRNIPDITKTNSIADIMNPNRKGAIIAPFWGDLHLSQYNATLNQVDGHGKVYYKRSADGTKLTIAIYNIAPKGVNWWYSGSRPEFQWDAMMNLRPGDQDYISADCQIVLDSKDSSVTIVYNGFHGALRSVPGAYEDNAIPEEVPAQDIFKFNTLGGLIGPSRYVKDAVTLQDITEEKYSYPWAGEYFTYSDYYTNTKNPKFKLFDDEELAVRFRQLKNTLRAANVHFLVRSTDPRDDFSFSNKVPFSVSDNYELLAGEPRIGAVQPVGLIQNLTTDMQGENGVNYYEQGFEFQSRVRIVNKITGRTIYNKMVEVSNRCLSLDDEDAVECIGDLNTRVRLVDAITNQGNGNYDASTYSPAAYRSMGTEGIPPYKFAEVTFPRFEPNKYFDNNIGAQRVYLVAEPKVPGTGERYADDWAYDDTVSLDLNIIRRIENLNDDVTEYHVDLGTGIAIPSALNWVNINAEVVSGDDVSKHPLAPRGEFEALNDKNFKLTSPVIKMNRVTLTGNEPPAKFADVRGMNGDEIRSYPIDMRGKNGAILSLAVQRTEYREDWRRDYMDNQLVGPEPRTIYTSLNDNSSFNVFDDKKAVSAVPDELVVQFALPSEDGVNGMVNDIVWNYDDEYKPDTLRHTPALTLFGAGGYMLGYLEEDHNMPLPLPENPNYNGLRPDRYDDGIDFEYKKFFIQIPDTFINWENEAARNFRFRIKVLATNDKKNPAIEDDNDDFFVDNIRILVPQEVTDIEVNSVSVDWPYTLIPASQATSVPVKISVSNNTAIDAPVFAVKVSIHRMTKDEEGNVVVEDNPIYCRLENIGNLNGGNSLDVSMPNWDIRRSQVDTTAWYRIYAEAVYPETDLIPSNDITYTDVKIEFGDEFAYDLDPNNPVNDVPEEMGVLGRGLNLFGSTYAEADGGRPFTVEDRAGTQVGTGSGEIAVKFNVLSADTLRGLKAFFGNLNSYPDLMRVRLWSNKEVESKFNSMDMVDYPDSIITEILRNRAINDGDNVIRLNQFVTYLFDEPVILQKGTYWLSVEQQSGKRGLQLGASASRSAMRITKFFDAFDGDANTIDTFGVQGLNLLIDKSFRKQTVDGRLINNNYFVYENVSDSKDWVPFTPPMGNPAYPHFSHYGFFNQTMTLSGGTWIPLLRPYFGYKTHGQYADEYQYCPQDIPVEMVSFDGNVRDKGIDLFWETASESNNYGFYVERRPFTNSDDVQEWTEVGFVNGSGNSNIVNRYNYFDNEVVAGNTYQYRIKQVDFDGTASCSSSNIVTLTYDYYAQAELLPNTPNPFTNSTNINFNLPTNQEITIEVLDVYGNVVNQIYNGLANAGKNNVEWNGKDSFGNELATGTYIYRLTTDNKVLTGKMTLIK